MSRGFPSDDFDEMSVQVSQMIGKLWQWHYGDFSPKDSWSPTINVYRLPRRLAVCVDLAGLDKQTIDVRVETGKLAIRGVRPAPDPPRSPEEPMRILTMEIDHGPFRREIKLPEQVDLSRVESHYDGGLLWIYLPLRNPG
ncbi:MAG: Hsp20/alpha crystallin family protein [Phycisphaeraceae bacterium]|nr:Hsp20/alpha crystallin family protein [Phycisphaeraceae bacterium]